MLTLFILWLIGCTALAVLNAKFWTISPDMEDLQYQQDKSQNKPCINPILEDTWHTVRVFIFIFLLAAVVWLICQAI